MNTYFYIPIKFKVVLALAFAIQTDPIASDIIQ